MIKNVDMVFEFKNVIPNSPMPLEGMYQQACQNDKVTVDHWLNRWIANVKSTKERFGSFKEHGIGPLFGTNKFKPAIIVGSGPSLKNNIERLKSVRGIPIISCLHNYHYMVDNEIPVDYYVSLDAGDVVIEEISEGGKNTPEFYRESTKGKTLIAFIGSSPKLFESWQGDVKLFNCPVPNDEYKKAVTDIEPFFTYLSTGGNVLGASTYFAKAILGSNPVIFMGADFCFSYTRKFHAWDSKYDASIGEAMRGIDVWGNAVLTWPSYWNFKVWFDWLSSAVPGLYINCTEGGLMGSYPEGNIASIRQMTLDDCLYMYEMHEKVRDGCENPEVDPKKVLF